MSTSPVEGLIRRAAGLVAVLVTILAFAAVAVPREASAAPDPDDSISSPQDPATDLEILDGPDTGLSNVGGGIEPVGLNPLAGYPAAPTPAATLRTLWAGTMTVGETVAPFRTAPVYCIDLQTSTNSGIHYDVGDWTATNVPNLGYVLYILTHYYPFVPTAPAAPSNAARAAAVQTAIWFFTDRLVLNAADVSRPFTQAIVADAILNGPSSEPPAPSLTLTPTQLTVPSTGEITGPFTVGGNIDGIITRAEEVEVFRDAAGTQPVGVGDPVSPGDQLWVRSAPSGTDPPPPAVLQIRGEITTELDSCSCTTEPTRH